MRDRGRHNVKRQAGLVLQPGGAFLVDSVQNQSPAVDSTDSPEPESVSAGTQTTMGASSSIEMSSIVFAPNLAASMVSQTSAVETVTISSTSSSESTTSISAADASPTTGSLTLTSFSTNTLPSTDSSSSTLTASSMQPSAPFAPSIHAIKHTPTFIAAMAFLGIAASACIIALMAYIWRLRRRQSSSSFGLHRDADMERRDGSGTGLSFLIEKPNITFDTPKHSNTSFADQDSHAIPTLHRIIINSPGGRYPGAQRSTDSEKGPHEVSSVESLQAPGQVLGPLQVKNYMKGDFTSSCDEAGPHSSPRPRIPDPDPGTPRSIKPPFLGLAGKGLQTPWAEGYPAVYPHHGFACPTPSDAVDNSGADVEGSRMLDIAVPPLPTPPFHVSLPPVDEVSQTDGWGTALRTSIFNALTGFSASQSKPDGKYATFSASDSRSSERWRNAMASRRASASAIGKGAANIADNEVQDAWSSPKTIDHGLLFDQSVPGCFKSAPSKHGLGIEADERKRSISQPVPPLVVRKKLPSTSSKRRLRGESSKSRAIASRASSIYSPCPDSVKVPQHTLVKGSLVHQARPSPRVGSELHNTVESAMQNRLTSRPTFLRRPSTGSVCSFTSEASEMGAAELRVKKTLALRARRKRGMDLSTPLSRASPAAQCAMTADRDEAPDTDD